MEIKDLKDVKPNEEFTGVNKKTGSVRFYKLVKVDRKYFTAQNIYFDSVDQKQTYTYEVKHKIEDFEIYPGIQKAFKNVEREHEQDLRTWKELQRKAEYEIHNKYRELEYEELKLWRQENPKPINPLMSE